MTKTASAMNETILTPEILNEIKGNGYRIAIDDFQNIALRMAKAYHSPVIVNILTAIQHELVERKKLRCETGNFNQMES